jgi:hypothetical protein
MTPEATCAFDRCQAGGVILPGAPTLTETLHGDFTMRDGSRSDTYQSRYHPGCWAADQREREAAR